MRPRPSRRGGLRAVAAGLGLAVALSAAPLPAVARPAAVAVDPQLQSAYDQTIDRAKAMMLGNPVQARSLGRTAREEASLWPASPQREVAIATARWIEGEGALRANDVAASAPLIAEGLAAVERVAPRSKLNGDLLLSQARVRRVTGQPQQALADFQQAYKIFARIGDVRSQAKVLQNIGSIYQDAQDYDRLIYYYRSAEELYPLDMALSLSASNNIANAYLHQGRLKEAQVAYRRSLRLAKQLQSPLLEANILTNIADLAIESHNYAGAADAIAEGFKLTTQPAAASGLPLLLGVQAKLDFARGRLPAAVRNLQAAFAGTDETTTDQSYSAIHLTAYRIYKAIGDDARALAHLETYRRMDDEGRTLAASTNAALMTARFDFANQNARIATLKTGQLSRDVALTRLRARQAAVIFSGVLALLLTVVVFLFVYLRSERRNRGEIMQANERLARTNVELGDALHAKSQFLATTSHEIRTPLNGILGMTQVMLADRTVGGVVRDRVSLVDSAGRAMRTLVDDILDFAKMDSGEVRLDTDATDLTTVMPDIVSLWRVQAQDKGIALRLSLTGVESPILTDPARLRQIVFNLLSNAIKFTAHGEVGIDVRAETGGGSPTVAIAVSDTGIGIPECAFATIFEPFRQLDTSTTRQFGGTGLGLAISRHLARVLGGDITVASVAGRGSTFTLRLPYATAPLEIAVVAPGSAAVLVASGNPIRRSFLRTALGDDVGRIAVCDIGEIGDFIARNAVDVVVADVGEGDVAVPDDVPFAADLGRWPPVVVLIPPELAGNRAAWLAAGAARVEIKPLQIDALAPILRAFTVDPAAPANTALRREAIHADVS